MLILSRKTGEAIFIEENIKITILSLMGNQVRVGIEAPKDIPIHRLESFKKTDSPDGEDL